MMMPHPSRISGGPGNHVSDGDTLVVWAHEDPNFGSGLGLTAEGVAHDVVRGTDGTTATLKSVRLLKPHFQLRGRAEMDTGSRVIDHLRRLRHLRTYELESEELAEFRRVVSDFIGRQEALLSSSKTQYMTDEEKALELDRATILDGFQRRFTKQEARPEQYKFRADLLRLYGKCLITNCRVEAVLQAAHIIPFSESVSYRNDTSNGLILRADIHALFDKFLIAIHPMRNEVVVAPVLCGTTYEKLAGRAVQHRAAVHFVRYHYTFFRAAFQQS